MPLNHPADHPELMVIGDSLGQGVRSLTSKGAFFAGSTGARLAESQKWPFRAADHPKPVLLDLADEIRHLRLIDVVFAGPVLEDFVDRINANIDFWVNLLLNGGQTNALPFDNVAVAQALVSDLFVPASAWRAKLRALSGVRLSVTGLLNGTTDFGELLALYKAINFLYTLNPANRADWDGASMVEWVKARQPKRLIVTIGHNESIYQIGFEGLTSPIRYSDLEDSPIGANDLASPVTTKRLTALAQALAALPNNDWVLWDLLPKISAVANLEPIGAPIQLPSPIGGAVYHSFYRPVFSFRNNQLTGQYLESADRAILGVNASIQQTVQNQFTAAGRPDAVRFFDDFRLFNDIDFKNQADPSSASGQAHRVAITPVHGVHFVDNRFLEAWIKPQELENHRGAPTGVYTLDSGGIQSLDGMHLTGTGYAYKAREIVKRHGGRLGLSSDWVETMFGNAVQADDLVGDFPTEFNTVRNAILNPLRAFQPLHIDAPANPAPAAIPDSHAPAMAWVQLCQAGRSA